MTQKSTILADPSWFPASLDVESDRVGFAKITRQALAQEAFLDQRMAGSVTGQKSLLLSDLLVETIDSSPLPVFIFHSAFCCSTLLARALDAPNIALSLKEPDILMALANAIRVNKELQKSPQQTRRYSELLIKLLSRRFSNKEQLVIKPTNTANNILSLVAEMGSQIVILHSDLRSFLISVLKKGEPCKAFVRQQYNIFALDPNGLGAIPQRQAMGFTDLQVAATVWRHQMELFQRTLSACPATQIASLDSKTLTSNASTVLPAVARHFGADFHIPVIRWRRHVAKRQRVPPDRQFPIRVSRGQRKAVRGFADHFHDEITPTPHDITVNRTARLPKDLQSVGIEDRNPDIFQDFHRALMDRFNPVFGQRFNRAVDVDRWIPRHLFNDFTAAARCIACTPPDPAPARCSFHHDQSLFVTRDHWGIAIIHAPF